MNKTWHVDEALMERYAAGDVPDPAALSIETHLVACGVCRSAAGSHVDATRLDAVWDGVQEVVDAPRRTVAERVLRRSGVTETTARLLAVTPTMGAPWITTVVIVLCLAVVGGLGYGGQRGDLLLLVLAPLVPVVGTALVFGGTDVTAELSMASPVSGLWLVLVRTSSVLATSIALAGCASLLEPNLSWMALGWLIPSLALTTGTLALASRLQPAPAAAVIATLWVVGVVGNEIVAAGGWRGMRSAGPIQAAAFRPAGQVALLVVAVLAAVAIVLRRDSFEIEMEGLW